MDEVFVVSSIIDKLAYSWRDVKTTAGYAPQSNGSEKEKLDSIRND